MQVGWICSFYVCPVVFCLTILFIGCNSRLRESEKIKSEPQFGLNVHMCETKRSRPQIYVLSELTGLIKLLSSFTHSFRDSVAGFKAVTSDFTLTTGLYNC